MVVNSPCVQESHGFYMYILAHTYTILKINLLIILIEFLLPGHLVPHISFLFSATDEPTLGEVSLDFSLLGCPGTSAF